MLRKPIILIRRLHSLKAKHAALEEQIDEEIARPMPDSFHLQTLKRTRLRLEDQIARIARRLRERTGRDVSGAA